ncbi:MAG: hypothetical protein LiPW39_575 [Parcubacteria group bacterium LiPW_39]|nr:MAG: hypothetical protein LiPW39_575 [Parcubacteria group bacterium LiPW_39]
MKKNLLVVALLLTVVLVPGWAEAQSQPKYDLRQYPSAGRGVIIMGSDLPPSWFMDIWVNPIMVAGRPQGQRSFVLIPHPSYQMRSKEWEVGNGVGAVTVYVEAWERDRAGQRIVRAVKYPIVRYIGQVPDYYGYYWSMYLGLYELGVQQWPGGYGGYYVLPFWSPPTPPCQR